VRRRLVPSPVRHRLVPSPARRASGRPPRRHPIYPPAASALPHRTRLSQPRHAVSPSSYQLPGSRRGLPYPAKMRRLPTASYLSSSLMRWSIPAPWFLAGSPCRLLSLFLQLHPPRPPFHVDAWTISAPVRPTFSRIRASPCRTAFSMLGTTKAVLQLFLSPISCTSCWYNG
jgi:hypothetical protein